MGVESCFRYYPNALTLLRYFVLDLLGTQELLRRGRRAEGISKAVGQVDVLFPRVGFQELGNYPLSALQIPSSTRAFQKKLYEVVRGSLLFYTVKISSFAKPQAVYHAISGLHSSDRQVSLTTGLNSQQQPPYPKCLYNISRLRTSFSILWPTDRSSQALID